MDTKSKYCLENRETLINLKDAKQALLDLIQKVIETNSTH